MKKIKFRQELKDFKELIEIGNIKLSKTGLTKDYYISITGKLYSKDKTIGSVKLLKPYNNIKHADTNGYMRYRIDGTEYFIHRLVAEAFLPDFKTHLQVNHIDKNRHNNHINNLEICTLQENLLHSAVTNKLKHKKIVSVKDIRKIKSQLQMQSKSEAISDIVKIIDNEPVVI